MRGGRSVIIEPHRHEGEFCTCRCMYYHFTSTSTPVGVFIARGKEDALVTRNMVPGETVYGEKKVSVEIVSSLLARN